MSDARRPARFLSPDGTTRILTYGLRRRPLSDLYHSWLKAPWRVLLLALAGLYLAVNVLFGVAYSLSGGIENARPGSFADCFFFSVQTLSTIGYGKLVPANTAANVIATVEVFLGMIGVAMLTGLVFAKFARPTSRVLFSRVATVATHDGVRSLMFRMGNERGNQIVQAQLQLSLLRSELTREGERVRRIIDLPLVRSQSPVFALSWLAVHPIGPESPLYGLGAEALRESNAELLVMLTGIDDTYAQTIHARHAYSWEEIVWGARFVDIFSDQQDGIRALDYSLFHDTKPERPAAAAEKAAS